jgi:hypothetical protein
MVRWIHQSIHKTKERRCLDVHDGTSKSNQGLNITFSYLLLDAHTPVIDYILKEIEKVEREKIR